LYATAGASDWTKANTALPAFSPITSGYFPATGEKKKGSRQDHPVTTDVRKLGCNSVSLVN
jgi:hypothetical protein